MEKTKIKKVLDHVFKVYGQEKHYDKIDYQFKRAYQIFSSGTKVFDRLGWEAQYDILSMGLVMSMGASSGTLRGIVALKKKEPSETEIRYSPEYGYSDPNIIKILNQKLLG